MLGLIIKGFTVGIAYVAPIGMQNLYVINTAMTQPQKRVFQVAGITTFFDISLALACFFGIGAIISALPILKTIIYGAGSLAVIYIGISLIRSKPSTDTTSTDTSLPLSKVALTCFLVTWANPQALIDGTLLFGGFRASLPPDMSKYFVIGSSLASLVWFFGIGTLVSVFKNVFNDKVIRYINIVCGIILIYFGLKLGYNFIMELNLF